jgi:hypothetical protein
MEGGAHLLKIDFGVCSHSHIPDQIDDPFLSFFLSEIQAL